MFSERWSDSIVRKVPALHAANPGLISNTLYDLLAPLGVIPEGRSRSKA